MSTYPQETLPDDRVLIQIPEEHAVWAFANADDAEAYALGDMSVPYDTLPWPRRAGV